MSITFRVGETPRVYVERINIQGNTVTRDKVIRREFRLNEGDAFNAFKVKRSQDRIQSLGFFQENLEIKQTQGSSNDRVVLNVDVEEKSTGELATCRPAIRASRSSSSRPRSPSAISWARARSCRPGVNYSRYSRVDLSWLHRALSVRQEHPARRRDFLPRLQQLQLRRGRRAQPDLWPAVIGGVAAARLPGHRIYQLRHPLLADPGQYYARRGHVLSTDLDDPDGTVRCRIRPCATRCKAGRYLCDELGKRPDLGDRLYGRLRRHATAFAPTRGQRIVFSQDFAGLGGDVKYLRTRLDATKYFGLPSRLRPLDPRRRRLHPSAARDAEDRAGRDPPQRPLLRPDRCAASIFAASVRGSCACPISTIDGDRGR